MSSYISFFPALNGDSILIKIDKYIMLIDGGYVDTFFKFIKPELEKINSNSISLNHIVVTHIDKDHISGIIKLITENNVFPLIKIDSIWHNSFRHIKQFNPNIKFDGKSLNELEINYNLQKEQTEKIKNISAVQGSSLASVILKENYNWNSEFDGKAISVNNNPIINLTDEIILKLLSPSNKKLSNLNLSWKKELYQKGYSTNEDLEDFTEVAFESIIAAQKEQKLIRKKSISNSEISVEELANSPFIEDETSANGSSIAFIIQHKWKKFLFLADAHPSTIVENLLLHYRKEDFPLSFDLIKISHHGSQKNTSIELLKLITSKRYMFCTNGKSHNHPDKETIARIISQKTNYTKELLFNYPLDSITMFKDEKLMKEYNYRIFEGSGLEPIKIDL